MKFDIKICCKIVEETLKLQGGESVILDVVNKAFGLGVENSLKKIRLCKDLLAKDQKLGKTG
jgi:hypothetical protein